MMASKFLIEFQARGKYCFTTYEIKALLGSSEVAVLSMLRRLQKKGDIAMPQRGFYVIVPPEYRSLGCLPAEQFIPDLMGYLGDAYYAGLLSAAQYHGAAHQRPQVFQVVIARNKLPIECGRVRVEFITRKNVNEVSTATINTLRGKLRLSSPEVTAFDLVGYLRHAGGLDNVATVLAELAEKLDPHEIARIADYSPVPWAQRLGYLLDLVGRSDKTDDLAAYIAGRKTLWSSLMSSRAIEGAKKDLRWRLLINAAVEAEIL